MKKFVLGSIALIALAGSAAAADLPQRPAYKAPMMAPAPIYNWTGCYVGANIGGLWANVDISGPGGEVSGNKSGFVGGGQIGCDYQMGQFVIGIRDMFDGTSLTNSGTFSGPLATFTTSGNMHWFDTLTARGGYLVQPNVLLYAQGGVAWANRSQSVTSSLGGGGEISNTRTGWTVGGGVEWMFVPHWSAFLEGNYMDFGTSSGTVFTPATPQGLPTVCTPGCTFSAKANVADVLIGVNYKF